MSDTLAQAERDRATLLDYVRGLDPDEVAELVADLTNWEACLLDLNEDEGHHAPPSGAPSLLGMIALFTGV